jgi:CO/xanthine dehydrogenase FAD-binding subunit
MKAPSFQYHRAASVQHGLELIREFAGTGKFMSGGQTLMPMMNLRLAAAEHLIDVGALPELRETREAGRRAFVGGGVTHAMVEMARYATRRAACSRTWPLASPTVRCVTAERWAAAWRTPTRPRTGHVPCARWMRSW